MDKPDEIKKILKQLAGKKIPFILLRGYDFLIDSSARVPSDVDILVPNEAIDSIKDFLTKHGYVSSFTLGHHDFGDINNREAPALDIQQGSVREKNLKYMDFDLAKNYEGDIEGIPVLTSTGLVFHLVVHSLIGKGFFKEEYKIKLRSMIQELGVKEELEYLLSNCFGKQESAHIIKILSLGDFASIEGKKWEYVRRFWTHRPSSSFELISFVRHRLKSKIKIKKLLRLGNVISFIGLDGTGKTTLAESLIKKLIENGYDAQYIYMGRVKGHSLPMHAISKRIGVSKIEKKRTPKRTYLLAREAAYFADLLARYLFKIVPCVLSGKVMVCDRYAYDLILDKHCSALSKFLLRFLYPSPGLLLFLDLPEEKIIERKNEYDSKTRNVYLIKLRQIEEMFNAIKIIPDDIKMNTEAVYQLYIQSTR